VIRNLAVGRVFTTRQVLAALDKQRAERGRQKKRGSRNLDSGFLRSDEPFCIKLLVLNPCRAGRIV
jgi:hypothetical protein